MEKGGSLSICKSCFVWTLIDTRLLPTADFFLPFFFPPFCAFFSFSAMMMRRIQSPCFLLSVLFSNLTHHFYPIKPHTSIRTFGGSFTPKNSRNSNQGKNILFFALDWKENSLWKLERRKFRRRRWKQMKGQKTTFIPLLPHLRKGEPEDENILEITK